jgi:hypothetical protein
MKIPQYRFEGFPSTDHGTWWLTTDSKRHRKSKGNQITRHRRSPVPTVELLLFMASPMSDAVPDPAAVLDA